MKKERRIFESLPIPQAVFSLAVPTIITQLINIIYNLADTWYVGRTNNPAMVAALSVVMPIYIIMAALANLFGVGGSSVISRQLGMKNTQKARHVFAFCFYGGLASAILYAVIMLLFRSKIIMIIGGDPASYPYIYDYIFWTMILGSIPTVGNVLCGHLVRSIGAAKEAGIGMSLGGILNIFLDPLFMFVILPPGHEVTGAAIATLLSNTAALVYFIILLARKKDHPVFTIRPSDISFQDRIPSEVLMVGLPAALMTTLAMASNIVANALARPYGSEAVAGMGVAKKINTIAFNTTMGLTQGVLPLIGYNYGARNFTRMKKVIRFTGAVALAYCCLCTLLYSVFTAPLVRFFIKEEVSVSYGVLFLRVIAFAAPMASFCYLMNTVFQASGRKLQSFLLSSLRKGFLDIPGMFLFGHFFGAMGIVIATPVAEIISTTLAVILYLRFLKSLE